MRRRRFRSRRSYSRRRAPTRRMYRVSRNRSRRRLGFRS